MVPGDATVVKKEKRYQGLKRKIAGDLRKLFLLMWGLLEQSRVKLKNGYAELGL